MEFLHKINFRSFGRYALYMLLSLIAQEMVLGQFRVMGVAPMLLPAVAVAMGMFKGPVVGAVFSLFLGIFADMTFIENTFAFTVFFPLISFFASFVSEFYINRSFFAYMGAALVGLLATAVFQLLKTLAGDTFSLAMVSTAVLQALVSLPAAVLVYFPPAKWIHD